MRLIDADALIDEMAMMVPWVIESPEEIARVDGLSDGYEAIKNAPTIDAVEVSGANKCAVELIVEERRRQIEEWGDQSDINPFELMSILGEEVGELCQAVNETFFCAPKHPERGGKDAIIREAVQVAAVVCQIVEAYMDGQRRGDGDV